MFISEFVNYPLLFGKPVSAAFYPRNIDYAGVFNDDDSDYLSRTPSETGDRQKWIFSVWVKEGNLGTNTFIFGSHEDGENTTSFYINSQHKIYFTNGDGGGAGAIVFVSTPLYRDPTNYMNIVVECDTTQAVEADRFNIFVNGSKVTAWSTEIYPNQNDNTQINRQSPHNIGAHNGANFWDGYIAEAILLDGETSADPPALFGETKNGVWVPKESLDLTYGTNGFLLDFANSGANLGDDASGNGNDFTRNGTPEQVTDTPTNNFATILSVPPVGVDLTYTYGNTKALQPNAGGNDIGVSSIEVPLNFRFYAEAKITLNAGSYNIGFVNDSALLGGNNALGTIAGTWAYADANGQIYAEGAGGVAYGDTYATGDIISIAAYNGNVWFAKNGTWQNSATANEIATDDNSNAAVTGITRPIRFAFSLNAQNDVVEINQGNPSFSITSGNTDDNGYGNFEYAPPTGYLALCSANIADSLTILDSIDQPAEAVYVNTRAGTGAEATISDVLFDVSAGAKVTTKNRDAADEWVTTDTVRGATVELNFDSANNESTVAQGHKSYTLTGYVVGTDDRYNTNGENFLDWVLREGAVYGLDIVGYTGTAATLLVNHSLGVVPSMIWTKVRDNAGNPRAWPVYHSLAASDPETDYGFLDQNLAFSDNDTMWNDTAPTSTQFTVETSINNESGKDHIAYLFADIPGLCKAFAYTGNGNADGPYVPLGFRSIIYFIKEVPNADSWLFYNGKTQVYNPVETETLVLDDTAAEATKGPLDILAQGLKIRDTDGDYNTNAALYVGFAWAEQFGPYSNAR